MTGFPNRRNQGSGPEAVSYGPAFRITESQPESGALGSLQFLAQTLGKSWDRTTLASYGWVNQFVQNRPEDIAEPLSGRTGTAEEIFQKILDTPGGVRSRGGYGIISPVWSTPIKRSMSISGDGVVGKRSAAIGRGGPAGQQG